MLQAEGIVCQKLPGELTEVTAGPSSGLGWVSSLLDGVHTHCVCRAGLQPRSTGTTGPSWG